jgi:hypothetical protein
MAKSSPKSKTKAKSPAPGKNPVLTGLLLSAMGIVTALGLFSSQRGAFLSTIQSLLLKGFGWGSYLLPLLLLGGGLLILLRKMEGAPKLSPVQITGFVVLYLAGLTSLQYFTFPVDFNASRTIAAGGLGGGYAGCSKNCSPSRKNPLTCPQLRQKFPLPSSGGRPKPKPAHPGNPPCFPRMLRS